MIQTINSKLKEVMPILFAVLAVVWLGSFFLAPFNGKISDFPQYYAPGRMICIGRGHEAYDADTIIKMEHEWFPDMGERTLPTYLPPPSIFWFIPLGFMSPSVGDIVWKLIQLSSLVGGVIMLRKTFALNRKATFWLIATICASGPAFAATQLEQISMPIFFAISLAIWALKFEKSWFAAAALAVLMLKPQEGLPLLVYLAGAKRYRVIAQTAAILLVATLVVLLLIGTQGLAGYTSHITSGMQTDTLMQSELGPTIRGQLLRIAPQLKTPVSLLSAAICVLAYIFIFFSGRKFSTSSAWTGAMLLVAMPLGLVTCLHLHSYDLTLLIPSLVLVMSGPMENAIPAWFIGAGFLLVGAFMVPFYIYIHFDYLLKEHWILNPHFFAMLTLSLGLTYLAYRYRSQLETKVKTDQAQSTAT